MTTHDEFNDPNGIDWPAYPPSNRLVARRTLVDPVEGDDWNVEERDVAGERSLFFRREAGWVRVREYPADWLTVPDESLLELCRHPQTSVGAASMRLARVLVIDDSPADRYIAKRRLEHLASEVFEADGAITGFEMARLTKPDLILLDYVMPGVVDSDAIRLLKSDPQLAAIPILFYTGHTECVAPEARALARGVLSKHEFMLDGALTTVALAMAR